MKVLVAIPLLLAAACSPEPQSEAERQADVAEVEANQDVPAIALSPETIRYREIEKYNLYGAGCSFAAEGGGMGAVALAMADEGYVLLHGELVRLAADKGSDELPYLARRKYDGREYSFTLEVVEGEAEMIGSEVYDFPARLRIRDSGDRVVFDKRGIAQCGA